MKKLQSGNQQIGFTVIELLVAMAVFGAVLLVVTIGIMQLGRVYYKGVTESNTQNTARAIIDAVSQGIQFTGGEVTPTPGTTVAGTSYAFCVGGQQFSYTPGYQLSDNPDSGLFQSYHSLVAYNISGCPGATAQNVRNQTVNGRELMAPNMRLAKMDVEALDGNLYKVTVKVVYGDDDLLNNPTSRDAACKNERAGLQFCAVSELSTVVTKRVE